MQWRWRGETGDSLGIRSIHGHCAISTTVLFLLVRWVAGEGKINMSLAVFCFLNFLAAFTNFSGSFCHDLCMEVICLDI